MSLGETLVKVALGVAIAKGIGALGKGTSGVAGGDGAGPITAGTGKPYGRRLPGGLENVMKDALAGAPGGRGAATAGTTARPGPAGGDIGDLLDEIMRGGGGGRPAPGRGTPDDGDVFTPTPRPPRPNAPKGGLEDLLTGAGGGAAAGGLGGLLDAVLRGAAPTTLPEPQARQQELAAALALRAMIQAVKCDGDLDDAEKRKLMAHMGDATREELAFVNAELQRPVDVEGLARQVPDGMEEQVYLVSLMGIDLDNQREATYLAALAKALGMSPQEVNGLHDRMGAPRMFR